MIADACWLDLVPPSFGPGSWVFALASVRHQGMMHQGMLHRPDQITGCTGKLEALESSIGNVGRTRGFARKIYLNTVFR